MRLGALCFGAVVAALAVSSASASIRITGDAGGRIGTYLESLSAIRESGQQVIVDGPCLSACTLLLGVIPRERICVTRRARFGFHAAWNAGPNGQAVTHQGGTQLLMAVYPERVRMWINRHGGLTPRMKYLTGRELTAMYPTCR